MKRAAIKARVVTGQAKPPLDKPIALINIGDFGLMRVESANGARPALIIIDRQHAHRCRQQAQLRRRYLYFGA